MGIIFKKEKDMAYKNKTYVSFDADSDIRYYYLMKAWKQSDKTQFNFYDAHDVNNNYDKNEESIKASLMERFRNSKAFILLVGEHTKYLYKYVRWEIEQAIKRELPIIVVNLNGKRCIDNDLCPPIIKNELAIHISFNEKILEYALDNWIESFAKHKEDGDTGPYSYKEVIYKNLGL